MKFVNRLKKYKFGGATVSFTEVITSPSFPQHIEEFDSGWGGITPTPDFDAPNSLAVEEFDSGWDGV